MKKTISKKVVKATGFYALLCDGNICGVLSTKREADELAEYIKDCVLKHRIKKCDVRITYSPKE